MSAPTVARAPVTASPVSTGVTSRRADGLGLLAVGLACGLGVLLQAYVGYQGRVSGNPPALLFWVSLVLMYATTAVVVLRGRLSRSESAVAVVLLSVAMQLTRVVLYPSMFVYHDELIHVRVLEDILSTHHLFTANSLLPVTPHYPGLEIATAGIAQLTGLSSHTSGTIVLILGRVILGLALFLIFDRITRSHRVAAVGSLLYIANPQYLFFNSQFSYQTLALPLCFGFVYLLVVLERRRPAVAWPTLAALAIAIAASHHLTAAGLVACLVIWRIVSAWTGRRPRHLSAATLIFVAAVLGWGFLARASVLPYFSEIAANNVKSVTQLISGHSDHTFFKDTAGDTTPVWERYGSLASVLVLVTLLPFALWSGRRWLTLRRAPAIVLCLMAILYPLIPLGHLTNATSEVADRSSGFIFVGVSFVLAWWGFQYLPGRRRSAARTRAGRLLVAVAVTVIAVVLFVGGTIVGSGPPWLRDPGAFLVEAENRSVDELSVAASSWLGAHVSAGHRIYADRTNSLLTETLGNQHTLTSLADQIDNGQLSRLLLAPASPSDVATVRQTNLQLLLVDTRMATDLPHVGLYTDNGEYGGENRTRPPSWASVTKFDSVAGADRIYDNGALRIYDLRGLS